MSKLQNCSNGLTQYLPRKTKIIVLFHQKRQLEGKKRKEKFSSNNIEIFLIII